MGLVQWQQWYGTVQWWRGSGACCERRPGSAVLWSRGLPWKAPPDTQHVGTSECDVHHGHILLRLRHGMLPHRQFEARCLRHFCGDFVVSICWHVYNVLVRSAVTANTSRPPPPPPTPTHRHTGATGTFDLRASVCGRSGGS